VAELDHDLGSFLLGVRPKFAANRRFAARKKVYIGVAAAIWLVLGAGIIVSIESSHPSAAPSAPPLHSTLLPGQRPNVPLPALQDWVDGQVAAFAQNHKLDDAYLGGIEKDLSQRFSQAQYGLVPEGKGIIYFDVGPDGSVTGIRPVAWRTTVGNVASHGANIRQIESILMQSPFPQPTAPKHLAMVFVGSDFVIKDVTTLPSNMQLATF
jgi:hypothetical protein